MPCSEGDEDGRSAGNNTAAAAAAAAAAGAAGTAHEDPGSDSSEDERPNRNTIGAVPLEWYRAEEHIGYDGEGRRLLKKERRDKLDTLLARNDSSQVGARQAAAAASPGRRRLLLRFIRTASDVGPTPERG